MKLKEKTKENLTVFIGIIVFNTILLVNFLKMHYAEDTYCVISHGYRDIARNAFLFSGRPITAMFFYLADFLNLNIEVLVFIMSVISIIFISMTIVTLYKTLTDLSNKNNSIIVSIIIVLMAYITTINFTTLDLLVFVESGSLCIGLFFSVLAACQWKEDSKYKFIKIFIFSCLSVMCHQALLNIYVPLGLMIIAYKYRNNIKKAFINAFFVLLFYGIALIVSIITTNIINSILNIESRETIIPSLQFIFETYDKYLKLMVLETLKIGPKYWYIILIMIITLIYFYYNIRFKEQKINLFYYFAILFSAILLPILPLIIQEKNSQYLEPRMMLSFGASIGIMLIYTFLCINDYGKNSKKIIIILSCLLFLLNGQYIVKASSEMFATNLLDRNFANSIIYNIQRYEKNTNIKIKNIGIKYDTNPKPYYDGSEIYRCLNIKSLAVDWDFCELLETYSGNKYQLIDMPDEIYDKYFYGKDWTCFNEEQLVFIDDTLYICTY